MIANVDTQNLVIWSDEYSVQILEIDEQHKTLVNCINALWKSLATGQDQEVISDLLKVLWHYTDTHFLAEETLMIEAQYSDLETHRRIHVSFVEKLYQIVHNQIEGQKVGIELLQFLTTWLINHIQVSDQQFADFVRPKLQKGVLTSFEPLSRAFNFILNFSKPGKDDEPILVGLDMKRAIDAHMSWLTNLNNYIIGKQSNIDHTNVDDIAKEDLCMLGNWLKINKSKGWADDPGFIRLRNTHRTFHRTAAEVVTYRQNDDIQSASSLIKGKLRRLSNEIRVEIVRLYSRIHG
ncbi:hypothetical protein TI03_00940 [Achromatium sp. WMS1]|nr:hypothetical protein TI03_00940 [Achromatium sp. WMS1]